MKTNTLAEVEQYKTVVMCGAHIPPDDAQIVVDLIQHDKWWLHRIGFEFDGSCILRFGAVESDWENIAEELQTNGFSDDFINVLSTLHTEGFYAAHFDPDAPLVAGLDWYTDSGARIKPLAYDVWIEMDDADNSYFEVDGVRHYIADFMRLDDNSELKEYGFDAYYGESNTSALFISLSDDSDRVDLIRCM